MYMEQRYFEPKWEQKEKLEQASKSLDSAMISFLDAAFAEISADKAGYINLRQLHDIFMDLRRVKQQLHFLIESFDY